MATEEQDDFDYFGSSPTIRLISDTPTDSGDEQEQEPKIYPIKKQKKKQNKKQKKTHRSKTDANKTTASERIKNIIESQKNMIDRLAQQLKDRKVDYNQTLKNTLNSHEIEVNKLRIEIEKLNDENKRITQLQSDNIELKNKLAKYNRIMKAKRSKKLPTLPGPPKPMALKSKSVPPAALAENEKRNSKLTHKKENTQQKAIVNKLTQSISASISVTLAEKSPEANKSNPKLKKYETMKKIGMPFQSIINRMRMDQCSDALIAEFKGEPLDSSDDSDSDDSDGPSIDINDIRFNKYKTMKKINMPHASIINKMRMDGFSKEDIQAFEEEVLLDNDGKKKKKKKKNKKSQITQLALEMGLKPKVEVAPSRVKKLKRIHWKVIELKEIKNTIWEKLAKKHSDQEVGISTKFELQFQIRPRKPPKTNLRKTRMAGLPNFGGGHHNEDHERKTAKKNSIKWLDAKRDQMIQIGLKKVGLSNEVIYDGIADMDESIITLSILETMFDLLPSKQEQSKTEQKIEEIMRDDENDEGLIECCGPSEMFFVEMSAIPEVKGQLTKWLFCRNFKEIWSHRMQQTTTMLRATQAIKTSKALHGYLRILLAIGNLMNHGTEKSMAYGFNLDCLKMLEGIKDFNGKKSLAMFVYEFAYNKFEVTHKLNKELKILKAAVRLETNMIEQSVKEMSDEFDVIDVFGTKLAEDYQEGDTFAFREYVSAFMKKQKSNMAVLKTKLKNAKTTSRSVARFYGLDEDEKPEQLFKLLQNFIDIMDKAKDGLFKLEKERIKLQQKRQKEREKLKKKEIRNKMNRKVPSRAPNKPSVRGRGGTPVVRVNNDDIKLDLNEEDDEVTPLRSHFRKKTQDLARQKLDLGKRLSTTFQEKQALAKGKMTQSLKNNHIKQRSIMGKNQLLGDSLFGGGVGVSSMDDIAKMAVQSIEGDEEYFKNKSRNSLFVPNT